MTESNIIRTLNQIFNDVFLSQNICVNSSTTAADIEGWDSFRHIELIVAVEIHFGIHFHSRDLDKMQNVGDLVHFISHHLNPLN